MKKKINVKLLVAGWSADIHLALCAWLQMHSIRNAAEKAVLANVFKKFMLMLYYVVDSRANLEIRRDNTMCFLSFELHILKK